MSRFTVTTTTVVTGPLPALQLYTPTTVVMGPLPVVTVRVYRNSAVKVTAATTD